MLVFLVCCSDFLFHERCLCSVSKVAGKGASVIEYLIQVFFKRLGAIGVDNKQVGSYFTECYAFENNPLDGLHVLFPLLYFHAYGKDLGIVSIICGCTVSIDASLVHEINCLDISILRSESDFKTRFLLLML